MSKTAKSKTAKSKIAQEWEDMLARVECRNPNQPEFLTAVREVADVVETKACKDKAIRNQRIFERLTEPDRVVSFRVCWETDKGEIQINRGWRVQHCGAIGPYKGGLRFHPSVNLSILKFLAFEQTFKNALTGLPMGGGKGGSDFDPSGRSDREIMRFCQAFMTELFRHIGPQTDVPAGDINVGSREIGYLYGKYKQLTNTFSGAMTGKGLSYGGAPVRVEATGYGLIYFVREMLDAHLDAIKDKTVLISGSGNVALHAAERAIQLDAKVVTLSDSTGTLYFKDGLTEGHIKQIKKLKAKDGASLEAFKDKQGGVFSKTKKPWSYKADIALPCATQNELEEADAKQLIKNKVKLLAEGRQYALHRKSSKITARIRRALRAGQSL